MTVPYNSYVSSARGLGNFHRLLLLWKGSIYKLVLPELIIYMIIYFFISFLYRFYLKHDPTLKLTFEQVVSYCHHYGSLIPLSFVLGFFVTLIVNRWFNQFMAIPWPDSIAAITSACIKGDDDRGKLLRRSLIRYVNLSFTLTMVMMSSQAKKRFPTMNHFVEAGLMMEHEKKVIEMIYSKTKHPAYWVPLVWAANIASRCRYENRVTDEQTYNILLKFICNFRSNCGELLAYDWICVPLVYTQVVTLAVYLYFVSTLMGQQYIDNGIEIDLYFPFFNFLEFFFYMGWLKVAETLINPFGEDDDDFEINWLIDRNFQVGYIIVDQLHGSHPELVKDKFWDKTFVRLPYTAAALRFKTKGPMGSAAYVEVAPEKAKFIYEEKVSDFSMSKRRKMAMAMVASEETSNKTNQSVNEQAQETGMGETATAKPSKTKRSTTGFWEGEVSDKLIDFSQYMEKDHEPYKPQANDSAKQSKTMAFPYKMVALTKRSQGTSRQLSRVTTDPTTDKSVAPPESPDSDPEKEDNKEAKKKRRSDEEEDPKDK